MCVEKKVRLLIEKNITTKFAVIWQLSLRSGSIGSVSLVLKTHMTLEPTVLFLSNRKFSLELARNL